MTEVFLHAGAHRTGTSSFQLCLSRNRAALEGAGYALAYPGRDGAPQGRLRLQLPRPRHGEKRIPAYADKVRTHLAGLTGPADKLILSEENIPGPMRHFYEGRFFPAAEKRFATMAQAIGRPCHVLYVIRSYAALYLSAWRKRAEDNAVPDFEELVPAFLAMDRGWPEVIGALQQALDPIKFSVIEYGARGSSTELLRHLVPGLPEGLEEPDRAVNLSATDAALAALQARYRAGETLERAEWQAVIRDHAEDRTPLGLAAFDPADNEKLAARYDADLNRLRAMPGLTFIG